MRRDGVLEYVWTHSLSLPILLHDRGGAPETRDVSMIQCRNTVNTAAVEMAMFEIDTNIDCCYQNCSSGTLLSPLLTLHMLGKRLPSQPLTHTYIYSLRNSNHHCCYLVLFTTSGSYKHRRRKMQLVIFAFFFSCVTKKKKNRHA